jgi:hypothetical protein
MIHEERSVFWGGDRIGHYEKLGSYEPAPHFENLPRDRWVKLQTKKKNIVKGHKERDKALTVNL